MDNWHFEVCKETIQECAVGGRRRRERHTDGHRSVILVRVGEACGI